MKRCASVVHRLAPVIRDREVGDVRFSAVRHRALGGGFILLSFAGDTDLIYIESGGVSQLLDDRDKVFKAGVDFNTLMGEALSQAESIEMLNRVREEYL